MLSVDIQMLLQAFSSRLMVITDQQKNPAYASSQQAWKPDESSHQC
jgi:hypothetical protein